MDDREECEFLEWDSDFFGKRIARVTVPRLDESVAEEIESWCCSERIDCLYFLADSSDPETTRLAQRWGFRFVDARITLECDLNRIPKSAPALSLRIVEEADIHALREVARMAHRDSRFY